MAGAAHTAGQLELDELRSVTRSFLDRHAPVHRALALMETGAYDEDVWQRLATEMLLPGLAIPERYGGQGFGLTELGVALEELGRVVYFGPFFATALAAQALVLSDDEDIAGSYLQEIAAGRLTATVALAERGRGWALTPPSTVARPRGEKWTLTGSKDWVIDGHTADLILVLAHTDGEDALFAVDSGAPGLRSFPIAVQDLTRPLGQVELDGVPAQRVGEVTFPVRKLIDVALAALACEQAGGARACLELAVGHAGERIQFGRPIGSFQAVRHRCADMFMLAETAAATAREAVRAIDLDHSERELTVGIAASWCADAYVRTAASSIQVHGGVGFTWEHPAHLFFKRAKSSALMFGDPAEHRARIGPDLARAHASGTAA